MENATKNLEIRVEGTPKLVLTVGSCSKRSDLWIDVFCRDNTGQPLHWPLHYSFYFCSFCSV